LTTRTGDKRDVYITWMTASLIWVILSIFAFIYKNGTEASLIFLSAAFGISIGWFLGMLATPYNVGEKQKLSEIGKIVYGFLTGYVLSKIEVLLNAIVPKGEVQIEERLWVFVVVAITAVLNTFSTTYVNRSYWLGNNKNE